MPACLQFEHGSPFVAPSQRTRLSLQFLHAIMDRFRFGFDAVLLVPAVDDAKWTPNSDGELDRPSTSPSSYSWLPHSEIAREGWRNGGDRTIMVLVVGW